MVFSVVLYYPRRQPPGVLSLSTLLQLLLQLLLLLVLGASEEQTLIDVYTVILRRGRTRRAPHPHVGGEQRNGEVRVRPRGRPVVVTVYYVPTDDDVTTKEAEGRRGVGE